MTRADGGRTVSKGVEHARLNRRAIVAAIVAGTIGFGLLELYERRLADEISGGVPVSVLVATRDIARGAELTREMLGARSVPESYVEPRQIREERLDKIIGGKIGVALKNGESLQWTDLQDARARDRQLSDLIEPGMRALAVRATTFSGLIRPGDRVDVLARHGDAVTPAIQNLVVLAVGADTGESGQAATANDSVTLGGTPEEITALTRVSSGGQIVLALRNPEDVLRIPVAVESEPATRTAATGLSRAAEIEHVR